MEKWQICVRALSPFLAKAVSGDLLENIRTSLARPGIGLIQGGGALVDQIFESRIDLSSSALPKSRKIILISERAQVDPEPNFRVFVSAVPATGTEFLKLIEFIAKRKQNPSAATGLVFLSTKHDLSTEVAATIADFMNGKMESYSQSVLEQLMGIVPELSRSLTPKKV